MTSQPSHVLIVTSDPQVSSLLERTLRAEQFTVTITADGASALRQAGLSAVDLVILSDQLADGPGMDAAPAFANRHPAVPVILFTARESPELLRRALKSGLADVLCQPVMPEEITQAARGAIEQARRRKDALLLETRKYTSSLQRQVDELETLMRLGRQVTSSLEPDSTLAAVVSAAVELTGADEGSLLLIDEATGDLFMRASRNFQEDFVRTFRLPITDSLAGTVIRTGEPVLMDESTPQKIKTAYLVQSLLYVPLSLHGHVFGVLGVDNRQSRLPLTQKHIKLLNTLASFAIIALENARLFSEVQAERNKLESILAGVQDGVVVVDPDQRLGLVNPAARQAFGIEPEAHLTGLLFDEVFSQTELVDLLKFGTKSLLQRSEVNPNEENYYSAMTTRIPGVGQVLTLHDITNLKKIDRIKTDFVHTVSHDLRSPLTAILGYVELIERVGAVTEQQREFIRRVQGSVHNITHLIDDLLDLGRIESGFDVRKEMVRIDQIFAYAVEGSRKKLVEKNLTLNLGLPVDLPAFLANPVQVRQMIDHLLENAIQYTRANGTIYVSGQQEDSQVILQFIDTGMGIPPLELPYIFDRFYRASNASAEISGTGLGLSIVKTIVENHGGRIWVDSTLGQGSVFTVVLPLVQA